MKLGRSAVAPPPRALSRLPLRHADSQSRHDCFLCTIQTCLGLGPGGPESSVSAQRTDSVYGAQLGTKRTVGGCGGWGRRRVTRPGTRRGRRRSREFGYGLSLAALESERKRDA
eukprot:7381654-Prymnesium_polylepis.2